MSGDDGVIPITMKDDYKSLEEVVRDCPIPLEIRNHIRTITNLYFENKINN